MLKVLKPTLMQILLVARVLQTQRMQTIETMFFQELVSLFVMLSVPLFGVASFRPKLPFLLQR